MTSHPRVATAVAIGGPQVCGENPRMVPSRRTRRRYVMAILAFTGVFVAWLLWPTADPRFVGRWFLEGDPSFSYTLQSNGHGFHRTPPGLPLMPANGAATPKIVVRDWPFRWYVEGSEIVMLWDEESGLPGFKLYLVQLYERLRHGRVSSGLQSRRRIVKCADDRLTFEWDIGESNWDASHSTVTEKWLRKGDVP
jgi:hypothetical protein